MHSPLTIDTHFIRAPLRYASCKGLDTADLLKKVNISNDVFQQRNTRVHVNQYVDLIQAVWAAMDDEYSGLSGSACKPGHFALMVRYVIQFDTLGAMVRECCRFYNTTRSDISFHLHQTGDDQCFEIKLNAPQFDPDHFLQEFMLVTMHRFMCWVTGISIHLKETQFSYDEPVHVKAYKDLFPGQRRFNTSRCAFVFGTSQLKLPKIRDWGEIREFLKDAPAGLMVAPNSDNSFGARIKIILLKTLGQNNPAPDFDRIAEHLNVSSQTLRRKLRNENTSYQQIKDMMRCDIAIDKLVREDMSIAEIAQRLGFIESSSFTRAFKQWTGLSPAQYRIHRS